MDVRTIAVVAVVIGTAAYAIYEFFNQNRNQQQQYRQHHHRRDPEEISLPFERERKKKAQRKEDNCAICFETLMEGVIIATMCEHQFHYKCLSNWLPVNENCPICRRKIILDS